MPRAALIGLSVLALVVLAVLADALHLSERPIEQRQRIAGEMAAQMPAASTALMDHMPVAHATVVAELGRVEGAPSQSEVARAIHAAIRDRRENIRQAPDVLLRKVVAAGRQGLVELEAQFGPDACARIARDPASASEAERAAMMASVDLQMAAWIEALATAGLEPVARRPLSGAEIVGAILRSPEPSPLRDHLGAPAGAGDATGCAATVALVDALLASEGELAQLFRAFLADLAVRGSRPPPADTETDRRTAR